MTTSLGLSPVGKTTGVAEDGWRLLHTTTSNNRLDSLAPTAPAEPPAAPGSWEHTHTLIYQPMFCINVSTVCPSSSKHNFTVSLKTCCFDTITPPKSFFYTFLQMFQKFPNLFLNQHCQISFNIFLKLCRKLLYEINFF